jgi:hypothetical protein
MIATQKWRLLDWLDKLEVIANGSTPIKSFTGQVGHFFQWLDGGGAAPDQHFNYGSSTKRHHSIINFGRWPYDTEMGLDLGRFKSMELQFSNDGSATYFDGDFSIDIFGLWLRDAPVGQFKAYMKTEEWRKWTTVTDETQYLKLPEEAKLRRLVLQVIPPVDANMKSEDTAYNVADSIKMTKRSGQDEIWNASLRHLWYANYFCSGRDIIQPLQPYTSDGYGVHTGLGQVLSLGGVRLPHGGAQNTYGTSIVPGEDGATLTREVPTDSEQDAMLVMGLALENCATIAFDQTYDPVDFLDLKAEGTVELQVHTKNAATVDNGTIRVMLDRYFPQP